MSMTALGMPFLVSRSRTTPCMRVTWPSGCGSVMMESPSSRKGECGDQKGPRMVLDVGASPDSLMCLWAISSTSLVVISGGLLFADQETYDSTPRTSEMRWASFREAVVVLPIELTKRTPSNHSSLVSSTSRMKSCRWRISLLMTRRVLSSTLGPMALMTASVKLGSKRCSACWPSWYVGAEAIVWCVYLQNFKSQLCRGRMGWRRMEPRTLRGTLLYVPLQANQTSRIDNDRASSRCIRRLSWVLEAAAERPAVKLWHAKDGAKLHDCRTLQCPAIALVQ